MKFNKFKYLIYILLLFSLTSCNLNALKEVLKEIIINDHQFDTSKIEVERDVGCSIEFLDNAFNAKEDEYGNPLILDNYQVANDEYDNVNRANITENITDLKYCDYLTPTTGKINGLVIPVDFEDYPAKKINEPAKIPSYQSVASYYYNSSYGQLDMHFDVLDWQRLKYKSTHYENSNDFDGDASGASEIIYEVLSYLQYELDLSKYDNDKDGIIDSLYIIYSKPFNSNSTFWWAFQYLTFEDYKFDDLYTCYYVFASYDFLFESKMAITYIHETGHMFGLEDYYDYDSKEGFNKGGLGSSDMMDYNFGDHNPFSKMALGWINNPLLVTGFDDDESVTINLKSYELYGDVILLADNYDLDKGMFQDYFLIIYTDIDSKVNKNNTVYKKNGIKVYRIHGELKEYVDGSTTYEYFKYDNSYTNHNLIDAFNKSILNPIYSKNEYKEICANDSDLFTKGNTCSNLFYYTQASSPSSYKFTVGYLYEDHAEITISKK